MNTRDTEIAVKFLISELESTSITPDAAIRYIAYFLANIENTENWALRSDELVATLERIFAHP